MHDKRVRLKAEPIHARYPHRPVVRVEDLRSVRMPRAIPQFLARRCCRIIPDDNGQSNRYYQYDYKEYTSHHEQARQLSWPFLRRSQRQGQRFGRLII